jgi:hypothetical protein
MGLPLERIWHLSIGNTALMRVRPFAPVIGGAQPQIGRILTMNDCTHVEELAMRSGEI